MSVQEIDQQTALRLYQAMLEARLLEQRAYDLFLENLIKGTSHLGLGQEAIAAGVCLALRSDDYSFSTYRGHTQTLLRGASMVGVLGELMGKESGILRGKGGSMHLGSVEHGAMGSFAVIGPQMVIANGAAWSARYRGTEQVAVAFMGDGATNIGTFHEALNLAAVWNLPVIFVCENNLYMEYTPIKNVIPVENPAADRAKAYGLEPLVVDGNDVEAVYQLASNVIDKARSGKGPSIIEAKTYRHGGHSRADPAKYRPKEEVDAWLKRDPVETYRQRLLDRGISESDLKGIDEKVKQAVEQATETAKASGPPPTDIALTDVWADGGAAWRQ